MYVASELKSPSRLFSCLVPKEKMLQESPRNLVNIPEGYRKRRGGPLGNSRTQTEASNQPGNSCCNETGCGRSYQTSLCQAVTETTTGKQ